MAGREILVMIAVLEIRAIELAAPAAAATASWTSSTFSRLSVSSASVRERFTLDTFQTKYSKNPTTISATIAAGISSASESGHSWHVVPAVKYPSAQMAQPLPVVPS